MVSKLVVSTIISVLSSVISLLHNLPSSTSTPAAATSYPYCYHNFIKMFSFSITSRCPFWRNAGDVPLQQQQKYMLQQVKYSDKIQNRSSQHQRETRCMSFLLCTVLLLQKRVLQIQPAQAMVYVENNTFASLPATFGRYMVDGKMYEARLQYFHDNPYLCDIDEKTIHQFVPPTGGVQINHFGGGSSNITLYEESVALLVIRGNCPFQKKASIAEYIDASIKVVLIANFNLDNDPELDETIVPMFSQHEDTRLVLLSISHATGQALKKYLSEVPSNITSIGGPMIQFDATSPYGMLTEGDLESMMLSALGIFFMLISFTGCLIILTGTYHQLLLYHTGGGNNPLTAATQRRLLTEEEVQQFTTQKESGEVGVVQPSQTMHERESADAEQCAVCLGEFDTDEDIAILPCQHQFHTTCITPWLTERQSKCPLCKFDVLQHIRDQSSTSTTPPDTASEESNDSDDDDATQYLPDTASSLPPTTTNTVSFWDQLRRYRWTSIATHNNDDREQQQQQQLHLDGVVMRVVEVLSTAASEDFRNEYHNNDTEMNNDVVDDQDHQNTMSNLEMIEQNRNVPVFRTLS
jgi:Ring finger domain